MELKKRSELTIDEMCLSTDNGSKFTSRFFVESLGQKGLEPRLIILTHLTEKLTLWIKKEVLSFIWINK